MLLNNMEQHVQKSVYYERAIKSGLLRLRYVIKSDDDSRE